MKRNKYQATRLMAIRGGCKIYQPVEVKGGNKKSRPGLQDNRCWGQPST